MQCKKCGVELDDDIGICYICGEMLKPPPKVEKVVEEDARPYKPLLYINNKIKKALAILRKSWNRIDQKGSSYLNGLGNRNDQKSLVEKDLFDSEDVEKNKTMGIYAYLAILVIIPIRKAPRSEFVRFHANQGLVLFLFEAAYTILYIILSYILKRCFYYAPMVIGLLTLVFLGFLALTVIGVLHAATGRAKRLPLIGKINILL